MLPITLRDFEPELQRFLEEQAQRSGKTTNEIALELLRQAVKQAQLANPTGPIGDQLDHLAGDWTEDDVRQFEQVIQACEQIDEDLWR